MAEAPEHVFLSNKFISIIERFSNLKLYGYTEADRKKFDFSCILQRDWDRPLVGQTLWKHTEGIDKDIRTMISDSSSEIWAYIARDTIKNRSVLYEVIQDYKNSKYSDQLFRLKVIWVPNDFDADKEQNTNVVSKLMENSIVEDILFNIVFGNLVSHDIKYFLSSSGIIGLNLAILYEVATNGFINYPDLSKKIGTSSGPLREQIIRLTGSGFLWQVGRASLYFVTLKGRVFLELLRKIYEEKINGTFTTELLYLLNKLEIQPYLINNEVAHIEDDIISNWTPEKTYNLLIKTADAAIKAWNINIAELKYEINPHETNPKFRIIR